MKRITLSLFLTVIVGSMLYAGPWVVGVNDVVNFLESIEQGTGEEEPPVVSYNAEDEVDTGLGGVWDQYAGFTYTEKIHPSYMGEGDARDWVGILEIDFSGKAFRQLDGTTISLAHPSLVEFDYTGVPEGFNSFKDYFDRHDLSYLEVLDLSGNDFHTIEIDGGPYQMMPLKTLNLSNNPNLTSLSVTNLATLELVDLQGTGLSAADALSVKEDILEFSPDAQVLLPTSTNVALVGKDAVKIYTEGDRLIVRNKAETDEVKMFDASGCLLIKTVEASINLSIYQSGIYIVKVGDLVTKIIK